MFPQGYGIPCGIRRRGPKLTLRARNTIYRQSLISLVSRPDLADLEETRQSLMPDLVGRLTDKRAIRSKLARFYSREDHPAERALAIARSR